MTADVDVFRTPDERFENLPGYDFAPNYVDVDGLRMHYLDEGPKIREADRLLPRGTELGVPVPQDDRPIRRCRAPGGRSRLAGFGRSDKPTDRRWYTYDRHSELISRVLGSLDLHEAIVVVQDWGGAIGLRWAVDNADRVAALSISNTGLFTGRVSKGFLAWRAFAEKNPDLPVGFVIQGATATEVPEDVIAAYEAPFPNVASKAGAAQFPLLVPTSEDAVGADVMRAVADQLSRWQKPALVAFSDQDDLSVPKSRARCSAI